RLLDEEHGGREEQPGHGGHDEGGPPGPRRLDEYPDGEEGEEQPDRDAERDDADGTTAASGFVGVADEGVGRRPVARLADAHGQTEDEQEHDALYESARTGEEAPQDQAAGHDEASRDPVGQAPEEDPGDGIDDGEG